MTYTVAEAKNKLPELIRQAEAGMRVTGFEKMPAKMRRILEDPDVELLLRVR